MAQLTSLNEALDNAQFADFWAKLKDAKDLVKDVPDFEQQTRECVCILFSLVDS